ncbi:hypothetical protein HN873_041889 [Arachis hypogaea]
MTGGTEIAPATMKQSYSTEKGGEPGDDGTELRDSIFKAETVAARYRRWLRSSFQRRRREMDGGEGVRSMTERGRRSSRVMGGMGSRLAVVWS